jgi:histidinol-phosphate aminotransferase
VYSRHAFAVYPLATHARGALGIEVPARDLGHDLAAMRRRSRRRRVVVFIANPEQPDRHVVPAATLEAFIASVPQDTLVVLDEAYNEYLPAKHTRRAPRGSQVSAT